MKAKVNTAYLHSPVNMASMGIAGATQLGGGKTPNITITTNEHGLVLQKGNLYGIVPWVNVKIASFDEVELAPVKK